MSLDRGIRSENYDSILDSPEYDEVLDLEAVASVVNYLDSATIDNVTYTCFIADRANFQENDESVTGAEYGWRNYYSNILGSPQLEDFFNDLTDQAVTRKVEDELRDPLGLSTKRYKEIPLTLISTPDMTPRTRNEHYANKGVRKDVQEILEREGISPETDFPELEAVAEQDILPHRHGKGEAYPLEEII